MAVFAAIARLRVTGRLPDSLQAVVACCAGLGNAAMIEPTDRPFAGCMARIAFALRCDMVRVLARCPHIIVATGAALWRAFKYATLVTGFAGNLRMPSGQWEARGEMVELFLLRSLHRRRRGQGNAQRQHHHQKCKTQLARQILPTRLCPSVRPTIFWKNCGIAENRRKSD